MYINTIGRRFIFFKEIFMFGFTTNVGISIVYFLGSNARSKTTIDS